MNPDFIAHVQHSRWHLLGITSAVCHHNEQGGPDLPELLNLYAQSRPPDSWEEIKQDLAGTLRLCLKKLEG